MLKAMSKLIQDSPLPEADARTLLAYAAATDRVKASFRIVAKLRHAASEVSQLEFLFNRIFSGR
jgi:hypothetical protein